MLNFFKILINKITFNQKGYFFIAILNFRALITNSDAKFKYHPKKQYYEVTSKNTLDTRSLIFKHELQGGISYLKGIQARGDGIGSRYFLTKIDFKDGDIIFDCGANAGDLLLWFQNRSLKIAYTGFEPAPEEYGCLKRNIQHHHAHQVALWQNDGKLDFFCSSQAADSSIIEPSSFDEIIQIEAARLDNFLYTNIKLLKLEAEGGELEVLKGAGTKLRTIHYISADLGPERGVMKEKTLIPVTKFLESNNFTLAYYNSVHQVALFKNNDVIAL